VITSYFRLVGIFFSLFLVGLIQKVEIYELILYAAAVGFFFSWPIWIFWFLLKNFDALGDEDFFEKFKSLYNGINITSTAALAYKAIFAVRRFDIILDNLVFTTGSPITGVERNHYFEKVILFLFM